MNISRVALPLRSNIGYFQSENLASEIENRLKLSILIYDEIWIEDGTFSADILEDGAFMPYAPPTKVPESERTVVYERDIKETHVKYMVGLKNTKPTDILMQGKTVARFKVDYYQIIEKNKLYDCDFIKFYILSNNMIPKEAKKTIDRLNYQDKIDYSDLVENSFLNNMIISNLNHDLVTSILLRSAVILDSRHGNLLNKKIQKKMNEIMAEPSNVEIVLSKLLSIAAPDFFKLTFEDIISLRSDGLWTSFRDFVKKTSSDIHSECRTFEDKKYIQDVVSSNIDRVLFEELKKKYQSGTKVSIDLGLGLVSIIPGYGLISTGISAAKSGYEFYKDKSSWFAFLLKIEKMKNS